MKIETIEVAGFVSAFKSLRFPYGKETKNGIWTDSEILKDTGYAYQSYVNPTDKDITLIQNLILRGDEHAKPMRGIVAYSKITAPIDFWGELETYVVGHQRLFSSSTMNGEGKGLHGKALRKVLDKISFGRPVTKVDMFSYQTLRRIVAQRYNHRKLEWHEFIDWVKTLPYANELILFGLDEVVSIHDNLYKQYLEEED